jgi:hypothetical protein
MASLKRVGATLMAIGLLAGVIYLGIRSGRDSNFVVWFGIASAIVAPVGLSLFSFAFRRSDAGIIQRLAKVPEIGRLVQEANTQEEKIRLLEAERLRLAEVIRLESRRQALKERIESLEQDAVRITREFDNLEEETRLLGDQIGHSTVSDEVQRLRERVSARGRGDFFLKLGGHVYRIDKDIIDVIPLARNVIIPYLRLIERLQDWLTRRLLKKSAPTPTDAHERRQS